MAALWFFFGTICMANAPHDCTRVVFDRPMEVTDLSRIGKVPPPVCWLSSARVGASTTDSFSSSLVRDAVRFCRMSTAISNCIRNTWSLSSRST